MRKAIFSVAVLAGGIGLLAPHAGARPPAEGARVKCKQALWTFARNYDAGKSLLYRMAWSIASKPTREFAEDVVFAMRLVSPHRAAQGNALRCCDQITATRYGGVTSPFYCLKSAFPAPRSPTRFAGR